VSTAIQIANSEFDQDFFGLPINIQEQIDRKIEEMGFRLSSFSHHRLKGSDRYRLRVGDYRIIYKFDLKQNIIHLIAMGNRREIYR